MRIESAANPRIKAAASLRDRRHRQRHRLFLVEGQQELDMALAGGVEIVELYLCPDLGGESSPSYEGPRWEVSEPAFRRLSVRGAGGGVVGVARNFEVSVGGFAPPPPELVLVSEAIEKPGNLGAMMRTAEAAGAGVMVCDPATDVFNPNVVRSSLGALFSVPLAVGTSEEVKGWLTRSGVRPVAATPEAAEPYWEADLAGPVAVVVGAEDRGLSRHWRDPGITAARIPMAGRADSLNAAAAAAILLFEAVRQRSAT